MKNENGKTTIFSLIAFVMLAYVVFCAFILISSKIRSDSTQKQIIESILKGKVNESTPAKAGEIIIQTLESKNYILDSDDKRAIEVYVDKQKKTIEIYYSYSYEMDFLLFKHVNFVEVEDSRSTDRWN